MTEHDCGHTCCPIRNDRFHDHFLPPDQCATCRTTSDSTDTSIPCVPIECQPIEEVRINWYAKVRPQGEHIASIRRDDDQHLIITIEPDVDLGEAVVACVELLREAHKT